MSQGQKILLGVTGSIAAYKAAHLLRLLVKAGSEVRVVMTEAACDFITPLTLSTLSKNPVERKYFDADSGLWNSHVELGLWADLFVVAPASANTIASMASGACGNLLLASYLSARCPVYLAPAMDLDMYRHRATMANLEKLRSFGNIIIEPEDGELASGLEGRGRMAEPESIAKIILNAKAGENPSPDYPGQPRMEQPLLKQPLLGKMALVTAGPTYEAIDPVRFIGNHSTGTMGYAIADRLGALGADVVLISGPTRLEPVDPGIRVRRVTSAAEMFGAAGEQFSSADIVVLSAAVGDYRPVEVKTKKIKKDGSRRTIELTRTVDIAMGLSRLRRDDQFVVGFALETDDETENARAKMQRKKFDMIVLNSLNDPGAGFGTGTNKVTLLFPDGSQGPGTLKDKKEVAADICDAILERAVFDSMDGNS